MRCTKVACAFTRYSPAGELEGTRTITLPSERPDGVGQWLAPVFPAVDGRFVWVAGVPAGEVEDGMTRAVVLTDSAGTVLTRLPPIHGRSSSYSIRTPGRSSHGMRPFHNGTRYDVSSGGSYFATVDPLPGSTVVRLVDLRTLDRHELRLLLPAVSVPDDVMDEMVEAWVGAIGTPRAERFREVLAPPGPVFIGDPAVLEDGTVWVSTPDTGGETRTWYRVDPREGEVGAVALPRRMAVVGGDGGIVWARNYDDFDVPYVVLLRLDGP